jgi:hypothetical protein
VSEQYSPTIVSIFHPPEQQKIILIVFSLFSSISLGQVPEINVVDLANI